MMLSRFVGWSGVLWLCWAGSGVASDLVFDDLTNSSGLLPHIAGMMGHGGAWGDFDGDGLVDLMVGGFCDRPDGEYAPSAGPVPNRLFRNLGQGRFALVESDAIDRYGRTSGALFADLDNSGQLALYIANNAKPGPARAGTPDLQAEAKQQLSLLLRNLDGKFQDVSAGSGACPPELHTARNIAVLDVDQDGLLDLFVVEDRFRKNPRSVLFRNRGNFQFVDETRRWGLPEDVFGLGHATADLNDDGRPDLIVGHSNRCFLSTPDGFIESMALRDTFAQHPLHGEDWPCGVAIGDINRDGLLDVVIASHCETARNRVFLNTGLVRGVPTFRDATQELGLPEIVPVKCPHVEIQDFNNDGWPDLYFSASWRNEDGSVTPLIFLNTPGENGQRRFLAPRPISAPMVYYPAGPTADFDGDGRLDLFLVNWFAGDHGHLLRNTSQPRHWLAISVTGRNFNRMGIGSKIWVYRAQQMGVPQALLGYQEVQVGSGYASGQPAICHFGLDDVATVDVRVRLPHGTIVEQRNVSANQHRVVSEPGF